MIRKIACILALSTVLPLAAEAQQPPPAPTKAEIQKVAQSITGDKAKLATYCKLLALDPQITAADKAGDKAKVDALQKEGESLVQSLGPDYAKMAAGLDGVDPGTAAGKDLLAPLDALDNSCGK
jgi:hypothetical protein